MTALLTRPGVDLDGQSAEVLKRRYCTGQYDDNRGGVVWQTFHASAALESPWMGMMHVWSVRVDEGYQGRGLGRRLMRTLTAYADSIDHGLTLSVFRSNERAIALYLGTGFEIVNDNNITRMAYRLDRKTTD